MIPLYVGDEDFLNILIWADSFFHESSNEFNKFCLKVNRTITLFGLTYKSERLSSFRFQGSPIRIWVCELGSNYNTSSVEVTQFDSV